MPAVIDEIIFTFLKLVVENPDHFHSNQVSESLPNN